MPDAINRRDLTCYCLSAACIVSTELRPNSIVGQMSDQLIVAAIKQPPHKPFPAHFGQSNAG